MAKKKYIKQNTHLKRIGLNDGSVYFIDLRVLTDWDMVKKYGLLTSDELSDTEKMSLSINVYETLLGKEQMNKLLSNVRKKNNGFAPFDKVYEVLTEIQSKLEKN